MYLKIIKILKPIKFLDYIHFHLNYCETISSYKNKLMRNKN